jgi:hypothetical protein
MQTGSPDQEVDQAYLNDLVQKALDRPTLQVTDWKIQSIQGGFEWDSAVFRFQGEAKDAGEIIPWSLILKAVRSTTQAEHPAGIWYWKREALAYQSGLLYNLPGGNVSAPICYEVNERPDGSLWLWLEDIMDAVGSPWPVEHYAVVARHLGQFNGAYLVGRSFPSEPWITRNWLRKYVEHAAPMIEFVRSNPNHPVVMHMFPGDILPQTLGAWDERGSILDALENLPQVFCHQDAFKRNLFARQDKTIAIDWGYMGIAPVGAELVALVAGSISLFEVPVERVMEMERLCFEGYLQGLHDAGWNGNPKLVRTGYAASCLLRYPIGGAVGQTLPTMLDKESRSHMEATLEKSADEIEKTDPALVAYFQALIPEALKLLGIRRLISLFSRIAANTFRLRMKKRKST